MKTLNQTKRYIRKTYWVSPKVYNFLKELPREERRDFINKALGDALEKVKREGKYIRAKSTP